MGSHSDDPNDTRPCDCQDKVTPSNPSDGQSANSWKLTDEGKAILRTTWCVKCPNMEFAEYIYNGNSLCLKHFKEEMRR